MAGPVRTPFSRDPKPGREQERRELVDSLSRTRVQLGQAYGLFNMTVDEELIESYVYEISALRARYNYLLRRVKELDAT